MSYVNIVHLSDLHLKTDETTGRFNQSRILDALVEDMKSIAAGPLSPDLIIFSGDIANSADDEEIYDEARIILEEICLAAGLNNDLLFMCAGNHDASRSAIGPSIPLIKEFRSNNTDADAINSLYRNSKFIQHSAKTFQKFNFLSSSFGKSNLIYSDFLVSVYGVDRLKFAIITINTAALSGAGLSDDVKDERSLLFPEIALAKAFKEVPKGFIPILVGHHPFFFLSEIAEATIRPITQSKAALYLSGHTHSARPQFVSAPQGDLSLIEAGSLYAARDWWNGYSVISVDPESPFRRVTYRKWHEQRLEFGVASDFSDSGEVFDSKQSKAHWHTVKPKLDIASIETWRLDHLLVHIRQECEKDTSRVFEESRFVEPDFERDKYIRTENGMEKTSHPEDITFDEVKSLSSNLVIFAASESGKTTLIRKWASTLSKISVHPQGWKIPIVIKFSNLKKFNTNPERIIRDQLPSLPNGISYLDLLSLGFLTVFVDDAKLSSGILKSRLDEIIKSYPKNQYVLLTSTVYFQGAGIAPVVVNGIDFEHLRIKQLRSSQLLTLIESHGTKDPVTADKLLQRMVQEASSLNVPITPVTGTFLIQIYTEDSSTTLINRANLVERYLEISLEKFAPAELLPSSFDFHNKSDLLTHLAQKMCLLKERDIDEAQFVGWIDSYMASFGLKFSPVDLVSYFAQARILERSDGMISFRLNVFYEYFCARAMIDDQNFRSFVLSEDNYLRFCSEISFYAAMSRKDKEWLLELFSRFKAQGDFVWAEASEEVREGSVLDTFVLPKSETSKDELNAIQNRIFEGVIPEEDRRLALDDDLPSAPSSQAVAGRNSGGDPGTIWTQQLTLLSSMLKNMELIPTEIKSEVLTAVIKGWLQFVSLSMAVVPQLAVDRRMKVGGIEYLVLFAEESDVGELARRLFLYMPISTIKLATFHLGTEKLRSQLEETIGTGDSKSLVGSQLMRAGILAQLGADGIAEVLESLVPVIGSKRYLGEVLYRMMAELVLRYRMPEADLQKVRLLAANTLVKLEGKTGLKAVSRRNQLVQSLTSSRLKMQLASKQVEDANLKKKTGR